MVTVPLFRFKEVTTVDEFTAFGARQMALASVRSPLDFRAAFAASIAMRVDMARDPQLDEQARFFARQAIAIAPQRAEGYLVFAEAEIASGHYQEAVNFARMAIDRAQPSVTLSQAQYILAIALAGMGDIEAIFSEFPYDAVQAPRSDLRLLEQLARNDSLIRLAERVAYADRLMAFLRNQPDILYFAALLHHRAGDTVIVEAIVKTLERIDRDMAEKLNGEIGG